MSPLSAMAHEKVSTQQLFTTVTRTEQLDTTIQVLNKYTDKCHNYPITNLYTISTCTLQLNVTKIIYYKRNVKLYICKLSDSQTKVEK